MYYIEKGGEKMAVIGFLTFVGFFILLVLLSFR
jgi:hypothetical protein